MNETGRNVAIEDIRLLLWGQNDRPEVFKRWTQGFTFSATEKSALEQQCGGPCAVLAAVQAFILKNLICDQPNDFETVTEQRCLDYLIAAFVEILEQCAESEGTTSFYLAVLPTLSSDMRDCTVSNTTDYLLIDSDYFHDNLQIEIFDSIIDVSNYLRSNFALFTSHFGVLCFLYSVILTKGIERIKNEISDTNEPLIHEVYGSGSQSLINLMITGQAVSHVWNDEQTIGALTLRGISKQSKMGFITLIEHLRYCTVGSYYKNPVYPIWIMGSETHLTVLFSYDMRLVSQETITEKAYRLFKDFDPDGNNFIKSEHLQSLLEQLDLVHDPEYVEFMRNRLDSENLGIILLDTFMDAFFTKTEHSVPDSFTLYHYNGLKQSNFNNEIKYNKGNAVLLESNIQGGMYCASRPILTCLQTKWPSIEINWSTDHEPSLN